MGLGSHSRSASVALPALFVAVSLTACGSSGAGRSVTVPSTSVIAAPATTPSTSDVADLEKQLDEIDQLLNGVDADLSQD